MNTISAFIDDIEKAYSQHSNSNNQSNLNITPDFILDAGFKTNEDTTTLKHVYESEISSILLTGATGFLGCHILQQLLDETDAIVFCIVRAHSLKQAKQRIQDTAQKYKLKLDLTRIEPMLGDMEKPQLGLSEKNWQHLCEQVQHIVHTASYVNHIQPYFAFKKSVAGTTQLLNIATSHTLKMMHFVSSTTASTQVQNSHFSVNPIEDFIDEEDAKLICSGYGQSKWVQEENIRQASELGVPYTIYRFAQISGSSKTGIGNTDDIFHRILKMMMSTSIQPKNMPYLLDIIPVDKAASSVAKGMNDKEKRNTVFHVSNSSPLPINEFYEFYEFVKKEQLTFQQSDKSAFIAACRDYIEQKTEGNTQVIMEGLLTQRPGYDEYLFETYLMPMSPYDKDNFNQLLSRYGIELTPWKTLYSTYFDYWKQDEHFKEIWPYKHEIESE
ncbi:thioester reductase domain-containing protein [Pseudoalteromonas phenolica]|nr:thioester reductase domain-containing protein [Pseudoalteromonas phenolica]RXF01471.1 NAD-dependent epimerase/dehydratase family protein [Pseudoalteromonas phenolica O-BC30]